MNLPIFDANVLIGSRMSYPDLQFETVESLIESMDEHGITQCLVYHSLAKMNNPTIGNQLLVDMIQSEKRLHPCWAVLPHYTGESLDPQALIEEMKIHHVRAVRAFPTVYNVELHLWLWEELLAELQRYRIPLFLDFNNANWSMKWDWDGIYRILSAYPELPVILIRVGMMANRYLYYLLKRFQNLFIETSYYQNNNALVDVADRFGSERLIFGSGMPQYDPRLPLSAVEYSGLSEEDKKNIFGGNLERLLKGVKW
jgi:predicted TIM-barrel fold metal-dependent hydrolase